MGFLANVFELVGGLGLFLYGMRVMSEGIHKRSGSRMKEVLGRMTSNRFAGVMTGLGVTAIVQSSSATTVMLVSLVNAGVIAFENSIGVIMGANIGTTVTAWLVSIGFKVSIVKFALPAVAIGLPLYFSRKEKSRELAEVFIGFGILFLGLSFMKESVPNLKENTDAFKFVASLSDFGFLSTLLFVGLGTVVTIIVQSSSAAMAITIALASNGWLSFDQAAAIVLGENIGTTITAYLASLGMNVNARRTARAHLLFNLIGVAWMLALIGPFSVLVDRIVPGIPDGKESIKWHLATFHTLFNLMNTGFLLGFVRNIAVVVKRWVPDEPVDFGRRGRLRPIGVAAPETIEANLVTVRAELGRVSDSVHDALLRVMNAMTGDENAVLQTVEQVGAIEKDADVFEEDVTTFLTECMTDGMSARQARRVSASQRIALEIESASDSCYNAALLLQRRARKAMAFHKNGVEQLMDYTSQVLDFLRYNSDFLCGRMSGYEEERAHAMENALDAGRDKLRLVTRRQIKKGADVKAELLFIDIVRHLEHVGDHCLNIAQAIRELG